MIKEIRAPKTGLTAATITVVKWHKREGEAVEKDELLLTIESEKTSLDINAHCSGYLVKIIVREGANVPISEVIGYISDYLDEESAIGVKPGVAASQVTASPVARTMANEKGIDLSKVQGTGPGGRIQKVDVERFLKQNEGEVQLKSRSLKETLKISSVRRIIAQKTVESKTTIPHYYLFSSFDVTNMFQKRGEFEKSQGINPSIDSIVIKACAMALERHPFMNASWDHGSIIVYEDVRIGFAVDTEAGIMIPHLIDPHMKRLADLECAIQELVEKARNGCITSQALECGALSVNNLGMYSIERFIPIIYPGEVAMMGLGRAEKTAVWNNGTFIPRDLMRVTLSLDHRIVDGSTGAKFLQDVKEMIEGREIIKIFQ